MKARLLNIYWALRSNYWFLPSLMAAGAFLLAILMLRVDSQFSGTFPEKISWIMGTGPEGTRQVLALIATSMITVAGVVFSITIVALALASQQFGPRLLQHFMKDRGNQFVLGVFTATFLYCIIILPGVLGTEKSRFVPYYSTTVGILMGIGSVMVLIYFIHHISSSIQASHVIGLVRTELMENVRSFIPECKEGKGECRKEIPPPFEPLEHFLYKAQPIRHLCSGYIRTIDNKGLVEFCQRENIFLKFEKQVGDFIVQGEVLARIFAPNPTSNHLSETMGNFVITGEHRTPDQDIEASIQELVEVALRALSPGINDPKTAIQCVDFLSEVLCQIAQRAELPFLYSDSENKIRLMTKVAIFKNYFESAFNEIRQASVRSVAVMLRLLESFERIGGFALRETDRQVLRIHGSLVYQLAQRTLQEKYDLNEVEDRYSRLHRALRNADIP